MPMIYYQHFSCNKAEWFFIDVTLPAWDDYIPLISEEL
jgi:hypothetical protein